MDGLQDSTSTSVNRVSADALGNFGLLQVDGLNAEDAEPGIGTTFYSGYTDFSASVNYVVGQVVLYGGKFYVFTVTHTAAAWNASHVVELVNNISLEDNILDNGGNDPDSNIK
jgi:hypothetical protein